MSDLNNSSSEEKGLRSHRWLLSYKTSSTLVDGRPVDILKDFYIPALRLVVRYDRVAGYFRSSSLAAASQGFSSFVGRRGKMRLIVGADLEPQDIKAILAGDRERLAALLNNELKQPEAWPDTVQNGVALLAWMVAHGNLEVRVAFRVHVKTGEPLTFESVDDGYVHEKWFVLHDRTGSRLYGAGTLNESKTALVLNAENIDIHCDWWGETDRLRTERAATDFENLWADRVPHLPVMTLPEAVQKNLLRFAEGVRNPVEINGISSAFETVPPPSALELLKFAVLRDGPKMPGGRFAGLETAPVEPWPHQAVAVRRLVETWPYSYLLCDEVGLGKTIEAGLAFRSLYLSGLVKRILVAAPASLTLQWQRQMASKTLLPFGRVSAKPEMRHEYIFPREKSLPASSFYEPDLVIVSTGLLTRRERLPELQSADRFDIALVDEAHAARRKNPSAGITANPDFGRLYVAVRDYLRGKAKSLWLATATPMQIDPVEVTDLLALTNRVGAFQFDAMLTMQYYEILDKLIHSRDLNRHEWAFLRKVIKAVAEQDPMLWRFIEESVIDGRIRATVKQWMENGRAPAGRDRELISRLVFSASPLSRVMLRHNRQLLEVYREKGQLRQNLARRHVELSSINFEPQEQLIYDKLESFCKGLARKISAYGDRQSMQAVSFLLGFMRLRFASSMYAFYETLQNRLNKVEATLRRQSVIEEREDDPDAASLEELVYDGEDEGDLPDVESLLKNRRTKDLEWEREHLQDMRAGMPDLSGASSKMRKLYSVLNERRNAGAGRIRQTVIFTRFYDTLTDIVSHLRQADHRMLIGAYSGRGAEYFDPAAGKMAGADREEVKERFLRGEIDVLVCTDAAAEGLNLQTADLLINFDLGWNPMKVEQRIGRIDRIGQKHEDIFVKNFCYLGSAEETVYGTLLSRLAEANLIVGAQQISLLPVAPEDFLKLAEGGLTAEELMDNAGKQIEKQRRQTESMEIKPGDLFDIYARMARTTRSSPVNLSSIWEALSSSQHLRELGCAVSNGPDGPVLTISGINPEFEGSILTVSRDLYEEGVPDDGARVHFASYGDPAFDAILEHFRSFGLPCCVRRVEAPVNGMDGVEMVGYAAACRNSSGLIEPRLVCSWTDLDNIQLAEETILAEAETCPLREQLERAARIEFEPCLVAQRIERGNIRVAHAQELLNYLVIQNLLKIRSGFAGKGALYKSVMKEVESLYQDRDYIDLPDLPAHIVRPVMEDLLFELHAPVIGEKAQLTVPLILAKTAQNAAGRLVNGMKTARRELRAETVLARLQREIELKRRQAG